MNKYEKYILDQIDFYRVEAAREPDTKETNLLLIEELINALVQYRILGGRR